jgi:GTPase SAR1 family protein
MEETFKSSQCGGDYKIICRMFEEYNYLFKIVVIGDSGVGKTNLVGQFVDEVFKDDEKPTVGV